MSNANIVLDPAGTGNVTVNGDLVVTGTVTHSNAALNDLTDVTIGGVPIAAGHTLIYNGSGGEWRNQVTTVAITGDITGSANIDENGDVTISTDLTTGNIDINTNDISSTNTNGNIRLDPNGTGSVLIISDLDVSGHIHVSVTDTITAAGSTQGAATAMTTTWNHVTTSTPTSADGVQLPVASAGRQCFIRNDAGANVQIWPATGDNINNIGVDAEDSATLSDHTTRLYIAADNTNWYSMN